MKLTNCLWVFVLMMVTGACWAYGGGSSSSKSCDKPKFSNFLPAENADVTAGSAFSFTASKNTYPTTIKVSVKEQPATIKVDKKMTGRLRSTASYLRRLKVVSPELQFQQMRKAIAKVLAVGW